MISKFFKTDNIKSNFFQNGKSAPRTAKRPAVTATTKRPAQPQSSEHLPKPQIKNIVVQVGVILFMSGASGMEVYGILTIKKKQPLVWILLIQYLRHLQCLPMIKRKSKRKICQGNSILLFEALKPT